MKLSFQRPARHQDPAAARAGFPLAEVGRIAVPDPALRHRHIQEARAITHVKNDSRLESVIGTTNVPGEPRVQLYGWGRNVDGHADATGWMYFCPLIVKRSLVCAWPDGASKHVRVYLRPGHVYRLNDFVTHWTQDSAPVVALYCGVFELPDDRIAIEMMQSGMLALAAGADIAPRVSPGFQVPFDDECYVDEDGKGKQLVLIAEAKKRGWIIATCAHCDKKAVHVDDLFPYHWELNRCSEHLLRFDDSPRQVEARQS